ncbi:DUF3656 domain-containing U32 family peptidase [Clostridium hydrogenum]|uniref:DUF3656 domain-containing U32 family peptidase n=1 Tax=Clostridium hydrogenum TaxID=2855764 RepID=UPI001F2E9BA9|nr:U32 family peptidase [Clostridium hydrogenum]
MKKIELLAPAGSIESARAAVQSGADAIYLGGSRFSARAYASNFTDEDLEKVVDYCHIYGVKVHVAVNILIKENELNDIYSYIKFLYKIGVDALIIQDVGVAKYVLSNFPGIEVHGSTQMTIHNAKGALYYKNLGYKRVVLSRELSLKEIEYISKNLNIETEMFIHGALCVCYSGQCLMSSVIGGRSGNRGRCAQPCRLPYTMINTSTSESANGYFLSTKDTCTIDIIPDIVASGVSSLKIEGRMKRPEYVAGVVEAYRKALDSAASSKKYDVEAENKKLLKLFNREGFAKAYLIGNVGKDMMAYNFPKNTGIYVGKVLKDNSILLETDLSLKDGVRAFEKGALISKIIKNNEEVSTALKGDKVKIYPVFYKRGDYIYKTADEKLLKRLKETYEEEFKRKLKVKMKVNFKVSKPLYLNLRGPEGIEVEVFGEVVQKALKKPISKDKIEDNLNKMGNTPFEIKEIVFEAFEDGFMPISEINLARREAALKLEKILIEKYKRKATNVLKPCVKSEQIKGNLPLFMVNVCTIEQFDTCISMGFNNIILDAFFKNSGSLLDEINFNKDVNVYLKVPNIIKEEFNAVVSIINKNLDKLKGIVTANAGILSEFSGKLPIIGDYKINVFNSLALEFYKKDLVGCALSTELTRNEIKKLNENKCIKTQMLIYGKIETMVSEYCPVGSVFGGKSSKSKCNNACLKGKYVLKDRMGVCFDVITDRYCRSHIYNPIPVNLIDKIDEIKDIGIDSYRIDFIDEDKDEVVKVLEMIKKGEIEANLNEYTRGSYKRGVE